ncbi:GNAT family N-acetyltransferase [Micromonospora sp. KC723]|uniref:GNAT family N-acetyltransferase n=1 Tax=Micromonospora sp. KC723 TaxID=2530381 RepID=UPI001044D92C|nr:GNAT family N-acetyltransferase [Micromonospora sp. KC723]TDB77722.1 GNAT family N-acetyltransferase [Micromonospora sp. KC723]
MINTDCELVGRAALLAATGHHPFTRHVIRPGTRPRGWRSEDLVAWLLPSESGPAGGAIGAPTPAVDLFAALVAEGVLHRGQWVQLPRAEPETLAGRFDIARLDEWDFLWTDAPPPRQADEERVVRLTDADHPTLAALIDQAYPSTTSRPGGPGIVDWYGIRDGDRIIACGADRSRGDIGFLAGLTVAPDRRGRGLGAALTAGMTRALTSRYDRVALGVYTDNVGAIRLYRRLGFTGALARTSIQLG